MIRPLLVESLVIVIFCDFFMWYVVINYFWRFFFPTKRKKGVNNCFKSIILSVFTTVASRLKSKKKEKEKLILKLNTTFSIQ